MQGLLECHEGLPSCLQAETAMLHSAAAVIYKAFASLFHWCASACDEACVQSTWLGHATTNPPMEANRMLHCSCGLAAGWSTSDMVITWSLSILSGMTVMPSAAHLELWNVSRIALHYFKTLEQICDTS